MMQSVAKASLSLMMPMRVLGIRPVSTPAMFALTQAPMMVTRPAFGFADDKKKDDKKDKPKEKKDDKKDKPKEKKDDKKDKKK